MLLKIHCSESVRSFISRNMFLNWTGPTHEFFKQFSNCFLTARDLQHISEICGYTGERGYEIFFQRHVDFRESFIFRESPNPSWTLNNESSSARIASTSWINARYCPECAREDINRLGFSYWRRSIQFNSKVCATHNVLLLDRCPHCHKPFYLSEHGPEALWSGCKGASLGEIVSKKNDDLHELKKAQLYNDMANFDYAISEELALDVVTAKFVSEGPLGPFELGCLGRDLTRSVSYKGSRPNEVNISQSGLIAEAILELYGNFEDFLLDLKAAGATFRVR